MKIAFGIDYRAPFGQSLHVCLSFVEADGHSRDYNFPMRTEDGHTWTVETSSLFYSHVDIQYLVYHYQVEDDDGKVMRTEWRGVPRVYAVDGSRRYLFQDHWRDVPLAYYVYRWVKRPLASLRRIPYFDRTLLFRVAAPQVGEGRSVALLGDEPTLGSWNVKRYLPMHLMGNGEWMLSINAYAIRLPIEYKYVVVDDTTHDIVEWESGENRRSPDIRLEWGEQLIMHGCMLRTTCALTCHDDFFNQDNTIEHEIPELYI